MFGSGRSDLHKSTLKHINPCNNHHLALFPGLPRFRSLVCVQYNTLPPPWIERKLKNENRGGLGTRLIITDVLGRFLFLVGILYQLKIKTICISPVFINFIT